METMKSPAMPAEGDPLPSPASVTVEPVGQVTMLTRHQRRRLGRVQTADARKVNVSLRQPVPRGEFYLALDGLRREVETLLQAAVAELWTAFAVLRQAVQERAGITEEDLARARETILERIKQAQEADRALAQGAAPSGDATPPPMEGREAGARHDPAPPTPDGPAPEVP